VDAADVVGHGPPLVRTVDNGGGRTVLDDPGQAQQKGGDPGGALHPRGSGWKQRRVLPVFHEPPARPVPITDDPVDEGIAHGLRGLQQLFTVSRVRAVLGGVEQDVPDAGGAATAAVIVPEPRAEPAGKP
jgi:hypothetical protein